ncbi:helix-turn-helix domain-containing protein [Nonomuraea rubra]|uniref:DNA-binding transcriptional MerR regulator n=1 Tax=Nonomuraea rubra TaxID=46180 RepID=A0A7X0P0D1_9ACTN|nr:helix-turn-helix domain-containing protein [Nonomuraea rubra]MBB6552957.1 DNA-binding transcriptional MerR regulator [Nonomuraea rubra]
MSDTTWTIGELAEHAARALRAGAPSPPNGRVRDVPGERLIRWYTTIGLVDPPLTRRGRVARYGRRHLLQLVAVKRLQAAGRSIAEIQAALTGATDRMLEAAAHLESPPPAHHPDATGHVPAAADGARAAGAHAGAAGGGEPVRDRFWAERPGSRAAHAREAAPGAQTPVPGTSPSAHPPQEAHAPRREHPAHGPGTVPTSDTATRGGVEQGRVRAAEARGAGQGRVRAAEESMAGDGQGRVGAAEEGRAGGARGGVVTGVRLAEGVRLVLDAGRAPSDEDVQAVLAAARPLLAVLEERELI